MVRVACWRAAEGSWADPRGKVCSTWSATAGRPSLAKTSTTLRDTPLQPRPEGSKPDSQIGNQWAGESTKFEPRVICQFLCVLGLRTYVNYPLKDQNPLRNQSTSQNVCAPFPRSLRPHDAMSPLHSSLSVWNCSKSVVHLVGCGRGTLPLLGLNRGGWRQGLRESSPS